MGPSIQGKVRCRGLFPDLAWESHVSVGRSTWRGLKKIQRYILNFFWTPPCHHHLQIHETILHLALQVMVVPQMRVHCGVSDQFVVVKEVLRVWKEKYLRHSCKQLYFRESGFG